MPERGREAGRCPPLRGGRAALPLTSGIVVPGEEGWP